MLAYLNRLIEGVNMTVTIVMFVALFALAAVCMAES